jgi:hypothetical protein
LNQLLEEPVQLPMEVRGLHGPDNPDHHVYPAERVTFPPEAITDDSLDSISGVSSRYRLLSHDQAEPGSGHSIEKPVQT